MSRPTTPLPPTPDPSGDPREPRPAVPSVLARVPLVLALLAIVGALAYLYSTDVLHPPMRSPAPPPEYGPTSTITLTAPAIIDFETGAVVETPAATETNDELADWAAAIGADAHVSADLPGLEPLDVALMNAPAGSASQVGEADSMFLARTGVSVPAVGIRTGQQLGAMVAVGGPQGGSGSYFFITREGGRGVIDVLSFNPADPRNVTFRYKMLKEGTYVRIRPPMPAPPPSAATFSPGLAPAPVRRPATRPVAKPATAATTQG